MKEIKANARRTIEIGKLGENDHTHVLFDCTDWLRQYPEAHIYLEYQRPGQTSSYPVVEGSLSGRTYTWVVQDEELSQIGSGQCQLVIHQGTVVAKSAIYQVVVTNALDGAGDPPSEWDSWLEQFEDLAGQTQDNAEAAAAAQTGAETAQGKAEDAQEAAEAAVEHYPYIGTNNHWYVWDSGTSAMVDTGIPASGVEIVRVGA